MKTHVLFMDNYFTALVVLDALKEKGIRCCGSVRSNRKGMPKIPQNEVQIIILNTANQPSYVFNCSPRAARTSTHHAGKLAKPRSVASRRQRVNLTALRPLSEIFKFF